MAFFEQYFQTTDWHVYMKSVLNSGARHDRMNITNESFFGLPLPYPSTLEQTKITNFLTALDDKITHNQTQLAELFATSPVPNISTHISKLLKEKAELCAKNRQDITMDFWRENIDRIIQFNDKKLLNHKGSVSHAQMQKMVEAMYETFDGQRKALEAKQADEQDLKELEQLEASIKSRKPS